MGKNSRIDQLKAVIEPEKLRHELAKNSRINIRLSQAEKESMVAIAKGFDISVTEYILKLHRIAVEKLGQDEEYEK